MPFYLVYADVTARGTQVWRVEADTPEEALAIEQAGGGVCLAEDLSIETSETCLNSVELDEDQNPNKKEVE